MELERSGILDQSIHTLHPGIVEQDKGGGFCQRLADNFDHNEDSVLGRDISLIVPNLTCLSFVPH